MKRRIGVSKVSHKGDFIIGIIFSIYSPMIDINRIESSMLYEKKKCQMANGIIIIILIAIFEGNHY